MKIYSIHDEEFKNFGRVIDVDTTEIVAVAKNIEMPENGSKYVPFLEAFENLDIKKYFQDEIFGQNPMQLGFCWGYNDTMNALEWHTCSEINVATDDLILLLGDIRDIEKDYKYDSSKVMAFKMEKGETVEIYATTLHYCPIHCDKNIGFGSVVGLSKGTNTPLDKKPETNLLFAKNKWLIAHEDNEALKARGVVATIYGENYKL